MYSRDRLHWKVFQEVGRINQNGTTFSVANSHSAIVVYPNFAMSSSPRGMFVALEAIDRAGKTTQVQRLCDQILSENPDVKVCMMRFPDRTTATGSIINAYLSGKQKVDDHVIHLLFVANRHEAKAAIEEKIAAGYIVLVDRYSFSGIAYSCSKENSNITIEWALAPEVGLPKPDVVLQLDLSVEEASKRGDYGKELYERIEFQSRVQQNYAILATRFASIWRIIDARGKPEEVTIRLMDAIHAARVRMPSDLQRF